MDWIQEKYPNVKVHGYQIVNDFFGEKITVSGLLTGQDVIAQLKNKELGEYLLLPCNLLRSGENVFLDDRTVEEVEKEIKDSCKNRRRRRRFISFRCLRERRRKST